MKSTTEIIPDDEVEAVHAFANFGDQSKRDVVDEGVLKYAFGYEAGSTQLAILREHGLLKASRRVHSYKADLRLARPSRDFHRLPNERTNHDQP